MVMKEVDTAKVSGWRLDLVVHAPPPSPTPPTPCPNPAFSRPGALSLWVSEGLPTEQREAGEASPSGRAVLHPPGPLPHAVCLDGRALGQHREQRWAA